MQTNTNEENVWKELAEIPADPPKMRNKCEQCRRPITVCWCSGLPKTRIFTESRLIILQHPAEEKRSLRTVPMLTLALENEKCVTYRGKKFPQAKHTGLQEILNDPNTILLYPTSEAVALEELTPVGFNEQKPYNVILLDGTWPQAKAIYHASPVLCTLRTCKIVGAPLSQYVIRTQPTDNCLSTLETGAIALSILENKSSLKEEMLRPLHHLCRFQLDKGAVIHHSKEVMLPKQNNSHKHSKRKVKEQL
ncbi:tRNA-uridine aminocarboxypropyltransferase 2 [Leptopilina heterotoma]|uniref:tRNA-uridine aminocarboxypropyltransferase 2 n=1 Tax=Leptopilina heterotoma TaxID=63436 RepID=UPI001CA7D9B2|nr:tRNA-uridine aminocarboxypropyltransferase 2 [Leptopilina heterotoma]